MQITIKDFPGKEIDKLISYDMDLFTRSVSVSVPSLTDPSLSLVDITVSVRSFFANDEIILLMFPNGNWQSFPISSTLYSSIRVE